MQKSQTICMVNMCVIYARCYAQWHAQRMVSNLQVEQHSITKKGAQQVSQRLFERFCAWLNFELLFEHLYKFMLIIFFSIVVSGVCWHEIASGSQDARCLLVNRVL